MIYKETVHDFLKQGIIKRCPVDLKTVTNLLKRAKVDIRTAVRNLPEDEECAFNYAYNAILRCGLALMFAEGYRPEIKDKHATVVRFVSTALGEDCRKLMYDYDFMRKKRNRFIYEPDIPCSSKEAQEAINTAKLFVGRITDLIKDKLPQSEFKF